MSPRRIVLIRHATAESGGVRTPDEQRELTSQGYEEASALGSWLKDENLLGEAVVCSPATRTRQTWASVVEATGHGVVISMEPRIYEATVEALLAVLAETSPDVRTVMIVGHAPGVPALAYDLCDGDGSAEDLAVLTSGFVPASCAVLSFDGAWPDIARGIARLEQVRPGSSAI